jgi:esterase/lipase
VDIKTLYSGSFAEHQAKMREHLYTRRKALGVDCSELAIEHNLPTAYRPKNFNGQVGVLYIHGFLSSPYATRHLGDFFAQQGILMRSILLPGHGTSAEDLTGLSLQDLDVATQYAVESLRQDVDEVILAGHSIGGALALYHAHKHPNTIKALCLFVPAFSVSRWAHVLPHLLPKRKMIKCPNKPHTSTYHTYPISSVKAISQLVRANNKAIESGVNLPCFIAAVREDITVKIEKILTFWKHNSHRKSHFYFYSDKTEKIRGKRVTLVNSRKLGKNILNMSHVAVPLSPKDEHYGVNGSNYKKPTAELLLGESTPKNILKPGFDRLRYNPDWTGMTAALKGFLVGL